MNNLVDLLPIIIIALVLWMGGLTFVFYKLLNHYRKLVGKVDGGDLLKVIDALLKQEEKNSLEVANVKVAIERIDKESARPIKKIGLVRYNPFNETGGDQSFSVCLLNGDSSGFVLTTLHTRDRTRVYTKSIVAGVSKYELSAEEEKALKEAQENI